MSILPTLNLNDTVYIILSKRVVSMQINKIEETNNGEILYRCSHYSSYPDGGFLQFSKSFTSKDIQKNVFLHKKCAFESIK